MPLKVLVAGAGIAGLAVAIALGQQGHEVHIFEKRAFSSEVGAAFRFGPYVARILQSWKIDIAAMRPVTIKAWLTINSETLDCIDVRYDLAEKKQQLGISDDEIAMYRIDAHQILKDHATGLPNVQLHLGDGAGCVDAASGTLTLSSGAKHTGDLIIGADGVHGRTLLAIDASAASPKPIGINMYRFMVPRSAIEASPSVSSVLSKLDFANKHLSIVHLRKKHFLVLYPCRGGELLNCATFQESSAERKPFLEDAYHNPASQDDVLDLFSDWPEPFLDLVRLGEDVKHWAIVGRDIASSYVKGRLALAGDMAHPTMPTHAAGANMGIEDAAVLGVLFDKNMDAGMVESRLKLYNELRYERTATVKFASEIVKVSWKELGNTNEEILRRKLPDASLPKDMEAYLWSFDAVAEAEKALKEANGL